MSRRRDLQPWPKAAVKGSARKRRAKSSVTQRGCGRTAVPSFKVSGACCRRKPVLAGGPAEHAAGGVAGIVPNVFKRTWKWRVRSADTADSYLFRGHLTIPRSHAIVRASGQVVTPPDSGTAAVALRTLLWQRRGNSSKSSVLGRKPILLTTGLNVVRSTGTHSPFGFAS
jgi:hypothetical protein